MCIFVILAYRDLSEQKYLDFKQAGSNNILIPYMTFDVGSNLTCATIVNTISVLDRE